MFYVYLILFTGLIYYFRFRFFFGCLRLFIRICKWKIELQNKYRKRKENSIIQVDEYLIKDDIYEEYSTIFDEKSHSIIFVNRTRDQLYDEVIAFQKQPNNALQNKNNIVFCGITNSDGDVFYDCTEDIRQFCFYFDKKQKMNVFRKYLQRKLSNSIYDNNFTVYKNDHCFSENIIPVKELDYVDFCEIFL
jgi:hypothetical protein